MQKYTAVRTCSLLIFRTITYLTIFEGTHYVGGVKVCNNFEDYSNPELTPNCFEDESVNWNISAIYRDFHGEIPLRVGSIFKSAANNVAIMHAIQALLISLVGGGYDQMDPISYPHSLINIYDSTGVDVAGNYIQIYLSNILQAYDYGPKKNREIYANEKAPVYNMSNISVPMALFVGDDDQLATMPNCKQIYDEIQPKVRCGFHIVDYTPWGHFDFVAAKDVVFYLFRNVIDKIKQIDSGKCFP